VARVLQAGGWSIEVEETEGPGDARRLAERGVADGVDAVVVFGGDGTTMQAAAALVGTDVALGLVPGGTGNILAGNLRIPSRPVPAAQMIARGRSRRIDLGRVKRTDGVHYFAVACGAGADARIMGETRLGAKRRWGIGGYVATLLRVVPEIRSTSCRLTVDGDVSTPAPRWPWCSNCAEIVPPLVKLRTGIELDDGVLDVVALAADSPWEVARGMWRAVQNVVVGTGPTPYLVYARGREIAIDMEEPQPVQFDGDTAGVTPVTISVVPKAIRVMVPQGRDPGNQRPGTRTRGQGPMTDSILLIHGDPGVLRAAGGRFEETGHEVIRELSVETGVATLARIRPDAVLLAAELGSAEAIAALGSTSAPVVLFADRPDGHAAAQALAAGALQVVDTNPDPAVLVTVARAVAEVARTRRLARTLLGATAPRHGIDALGTSPAMKQLAQQIGLLAQSDRTTLLLTGEVGVGKAWAARVIHEMGARAGKPLLEVRCSTTNPTYLESLLFGHEKGVFVEATERRRGLWRLPRAARSCCAKLATSRRRSSQAAPGARDPYLPPPGRRRGHHRGHPAHGDHPAGAFPGCRARRPTAVGGTTEPRRPRAGAAREPRELGRGGWSC
jgi:diacylglycerol kinase family enzyme/DNA-binding NarL/FixJ family response regulator